MQHLNAFSDCANNKILYYWKLKCACNLLQTTFIWTRFEISQCAIWIDWKVCTVRVPVNICRCPGRKDQKGSFKDRLDWPRGNESISLLWDFTDTLCLKYLSSSQVCGLLDICKEKTPMPVGNYYTIEILLNRLLFAWGVERRSNTTGKDPDSIVLRMISSMGFCCGSYVESRVYTGTSTREIHIIKLIKP